MKSIDYCIVDHCGTRPPHLSWSSTVTGSDHPTERAHPRLRLIFVADYGSSERVPVVFRQRATEVRVISRLLNDYLRETDVDVADSLAAREYGRQLSFADDHHDDPVLHVLLGGQRSLIAAVDHLLGLAACIETEDVNLAPMSLLRPIVVGAGMAFYLFDTDISLRERLRRGWNFELDSLREQLNGLDQRTMPDAWSQTVATRARYLAWGKAHGYGHQSRRDRFGEPRYWLTIGKEIQGAPSEIKLAEGLLATVGDGDLGRSVYRFTSSFIHTRAHAFTFFAPAVSQYDPETPDTVPLGVSPEDLTTWLKVVVLAVDSAASRCGKYFGWDLATWTAAVRSLLGRWARTLRPPSSLWIPDARG